MSFNINPPKAEYQASAGQTNFPFLFKIYFTTDIKVYHTPISTGETVLLTEGIGYSVTINGDDGGAVTLILVVENNDYIVIERELELTRYVEYQTSGDLLAVTLNADQDYQTYLVSDQNSRSDSSLTAPPGVPGFDGQLPAPEADALLAWANDGQSIVNNTIGYLPIDNPTFTGNLTGQYAFLDTVYLDTWVVGASLPTNGTFNIAIQGNTGQLSIQPDAPRLLLSPNGLQWDGKQVAMVEETEPSLGNPIANGYVLASQTDGTRSWVNLSAGGTTAAWGTITGTLSDQTDLQNTLNTKIEADDYATNLVGGTIKILVSGNDCYITTDGSTPGP